MITKKNFTIALERIGEMFPDARGELNWETPFQLLIAVILSAQTTDKGVNKATPQLFAHYPDAESLAQADVAEVEQDIRTIGLYKTKARNIVKTAQLLVTDFDSVLPQDKATLQTLPGVGRKTANVVLGEAFGVPGIAVDTHVERVSKRLALVPQKATVGEVEEKLMKWIPEENWVKTHHQLIFFGRYHCRAKKPNCEACSLLELCQFGKANLHVG